MRGAQLWPALNPIEERSSESSQIQNINFQLEYEVVKGEMAGPPHKAIVNEVIALFGKPPRCHSPMSSFNYGWKKQLCRGRGLAKLIL